MAQPEAEATTAPTEATPTPDADEEPSKGTKRALDETKTEDEAKAEEEAVKKPKTETEAPAATPAEVETAASGKTETAKSVETETAKSGETETATSGETEKATPAEEPAAAAVSVGPAAPAASAPGTAPTPGAGSGLLPMPAGGLLPLSSALTPTSAGAVAAPAVPVEPPLKELPPGFTAGIVKWFDMSKGYGFIQRPDGDDVFVHESCMPQRQEVKGLQDKEEVWFRITVEPGGRLRANDITGPGGVPTKGVAMNPLAGMGMPGVTTASTPEPPRDPSAFPAHTTEVLPPHKLRGTCKWWNLPKGYGFIAPTDGSEDVFVHQSNVLVKDGAFRSLAEQENLEFEIMAEPNQGRAKRKAQNVTGPGGQPVVGVPRPPPTPAPAAVTPMAQYNMMAAQQAAMAQGMVATPGAQPGMAQAQDPHTAAWTAYYAQQAAAQQAAAAQQQAYYQQPGQAGQAQPGQGQSAQPGQPQQAQDHQAAWAAYYAQQQQQQQMPQQQQPQQDQQAAWAAYYAQQQPQQA